MTACFYYVTYVFQSESTLYICLDVQELLARNRRHIWSLNLCNGTQIHNHLVPIHNHKLASFAKWLSARLRPKWLQVRVPLQSSNLVLEISPQTELVVIATIKTPRKTPTLTKYTETRGRVSFASWFKPKIWNCS